MNEIDQLICIVPGCLMMLGERPYDEYCDLHLAELETDYKEYERERIADEQIDFDREEV